MNHRPAETKTKKRTYKKYRYLKKCRFTHALLCYACILNVLTTTCTKDALTELYLAQPPVHTHPTPTVPQSPMAPNTNPQKEHQDNYRMDAGMEIWAETPISREAAPISTCVRDTKTMDHPIGHTHGQPGTYTVTKYVNQPHTLSIHRTKGGTRVQTPQWVSTEKCSARPALISPSFTPPTAIKPQQHPTLSPRRTPKRNCCPPRLQIPRA